MHLHYLMKLYVIHQLHFLHGVNNFIFESIWLMIMQYFYIVILYSVQLEQGERGRLLSS